MTYRTGDVVTLYMPMIPELAMTMLACARIGAIHSIVFAGFSSESLRGRIEDCNSRWVFTADEGKRGGKTIGLKKTVDAVSNPLYQHPSPRPLQLHSSSIIDATS
jgi:acetyl-CoA synthetase